jgi:RNA polymerase sigma-70 factor (ECF subfamily)
VYPKWTKWDGAAFAAQFPTVMLARMIWGAPLRNKRAQVSDQSPSRFALEEQEHGEPAAGSRRKDALFSEVTAHHTGLIGRIALSYEADPGLRRDLVQDILLAIWMALESYRGDSSLRTFIAAIAQKRSISHVTRRTREPRQEALPDHLISAALTPDEAAVQNDLKKHLVRSIQKLPIPQREAIVLCFEGFSYGEVGQVLGISTNAAMMRCQRAKASLKAMMGPRH